jgi:hypothetical protein
MADQELRLTVTLVDNATPQLGRIKSAMQELGSSEAHSAVRRTGEHAKNLGEHIGKLGHDMEHVAKHVIPSYVLGIAGIGTGFLAMGEAAEKSLDTIKDFSKELSQLDRISRQTGVNAGQVKEMMETFTRGGVDAGQAKANIAGLAASMADLTRIGSELRQKLVRGAGLENAEAMQRWLVGLSGKDISEFANEVKQKSDDIYQNMYDHQRRMGATAEAAAARAADARKSFLDAFGAPDLIQVMEKFTKMSSEEKAAWDARIKSAKDFEAVSGDISNQWEKITAVWKENLLEAWLPTLHKIDDIVKGWAEHGLGASLKEAAEVEEKRKIQIEADKAAGKEVPAPEHRQKSWGDLLRWRKPTEAAPAAHEEPAPAAHEEAPPPQPPAPPPARAPAPSAKTDFWSKMPFQNSRRVALSHKTRSRCSTRANSSSLQIR